MTTISLKNSPSEIFARAYINRGLSGYVKVSEPGALTNPTHLDWPLWSNAGEVVTLREIYARARRWNEAVEEANRPMNDRINRWLMHGGTTY